MAQSCHVGDTVKFYAAQPAACGCRFRSVLRGIYLPDALDILTGKVTAIGTNADGVVVTISSGGQLFQASPYQLTEVVKACA